MLASVRGSRETCCSEELVVSREGGSVAVWTIMKVDYDFSRFFSPRSQLGLALCSVSNSSSQQMSWHMTRNKQRTILGIPPASSNPRFRDFLLSLCLEGHFHLALTESAAGSVPQRVVACVCVGRTLVRLLPNVRNRLQPEKMVRQAAGPVGSMVQLPGMGFLNPGPRALDLYCLQYKRLQAFAKLPSVGSKPKIAFLSHPW